MPKTYTPTPCRRCGGDKGPRPQHSCPRYCPTCQAEVRREYWKKNFAWWCGACDSPHYCVTCRRIKRERMLAAAASRPRSNSHYFRPLNAECWWQRRCHSMVHAAIKRGLLPSLKSGEYACVDCGAVALEYDHRDYGRPFDVEPVCRSCNKQRGTAVWPDSSRFAFARIKPAPAEEARDAA